jgi:hypothetical protein
MRKTPFNIEALTELRYELTQLRVEFDAHPDGIINFPIAIDQNDTCGLNYIVRQLSCV